jgi:hypothetical protein
VRSVAPFSEEGAKNMPFASDGTSIFRPTAFFPSGPARGRKGADFLPSESQMKSQSEQFSQVSTQLLSEVSLAFCRERQSLIFR